MHIGIPKEPGGQPLVSTAPDTVGKLVKLGYEVVVETGTGATASCPDQQYHEAGAEVVGPQEVWQAEIVTSLDTPPDNKTEQIREGSVLIARLSVQANPAIAEVFTRHNVSAISMNAVPRIARAQSMDVLSSMANVAGYRAIIEVTSAFGRLFTSQMTTADKMSPAKVYVIGAGMAGLTAIGTANSMGAVVQAIDVCATAAEQVESMGTTFVVIPTPAQESSDGYAREMSEDQAKAALRLCTEQAGAADIVVTTAQIPGRPASLLLTTEAVAGMKPGSVIVDMAGGNCKLTVPGQVITTDNRVTIIGYTDLAGRLLDQASQLYEQNIVNLLKLMTPGKGGQIVFNLNDEIVRSITVAHQGDVLQPPPPVAVSAALTDSADAGGAGGSGSTSGAGVPASLGASVNIAAPKGHAARNFWTGIAAILGVALTAITPHEMLPYYIVLALAIVAGFYVITNTTHSLRTPLMSETNVISGIILVGAIISLAQSALIVVMVLACLTILIAPINIFGGFYVTHRVLKMFQKGD